jgi:hypothetical protein
VKIVIRRSLGQTWKRLSCKLCKHRNSKQRLNIFTYDGLFYCPNQIFLCFKVINCVINIIMDLRTTSCACSSISSDDTCLVRGDTVCCIIGYDESAVQFSECSPLLSVNHCKLFSMQSASISAVLGESLLAKSANSDVDQSLREALLLLLNIPRQICNENTSRGFEHSWQGVGLGSSGDHGAIVPPVQRGQNDNPTRALNDSSYCSGIFSGGSFNRSCQRVGVNQSPVPSLSNILDDKDESRARNVDCSEAGNHISYNMSMSVGVVAKENSDGTIDAETLAVYDCMSPATVIVPEDKKSLSESFQHVPADHLANDTSAFSNPFDYYPFEAGEITDPSYEEVSCSVGSQSVSKHNKGVAGEAAKHTTSVLPLPVSQMPSPNSQLPGTCADNAAKPHHPRTYFASSRSDISSNVSTAAAPVPESIVPRVVDLLVLPTGLDPAKRQKFCSALRSLPALLPPSPSAQLETPLAAVSAQAHAHALALEMEVAGTGEFNQEVQSDNMTCSAASLAASPKIVQVCR